MTALTLLSAVGLGTVIGLGARLTLPPARGLPVWLLPCAAVASSVLAVIVVVLAGSAFGWPVPHALALQAAFAVLGVTAVVGTARRGGNGRTR